jgi:dTMP kinase
VARARGRNQRNKHIADEGRFELEKAAFFERVFKAYLAIARREPKRVVKVESTATIPVVQSEIWRAVQTRLLTRKAASR